jgi:hypothetical protein
LNTKFERITKEQKLYRKILCEMPDIKVFDKGCKFGTALFLSSLIKWCDQLISGNVESLTPTELKEILLKTMKHDEETDSYLNELLKEESK